MCCLWLCASENQPLQESECNKSFNNSIVQTRDLVLTRKTRKQLFSSAKDENKKKQVTSYILGVFNADLKKGEIY